MINRFAQFCIRKRVPVVVILGLLTAFFAYHGAHIKVMTIFEDLQPTSHPYVQINERFKDTFGGSNIVTFMIEADQGDVFQLPVLRKVQELTQGLSKIDAVNTFQIISLAGKKLKKVKASTEGIESAPYMWPSLPKDQAEIEQLKEAVLRDPLVYGPVVSRDMKATLVTVDFFDKLIDHDVAFGQIQALVKRLDGGGVHISVVGNPVLYGWVNHYLPETFQLVGLALALFVVTLFIVNRTWRGTFLPLVTGVVSASWALGIAKLLNINFDPLVMVIAMLITARAISHSVQILTRFHEEVERIEHHSETSAAAARITLADLLRPGVLGISIDAGCIAVVAMSPIPLLQKLVILACVWVGTLTVSAVVLTPVLLSWVAHPRGYVHKINIDYYLLRPFLEFCVRATQSRARYGIVAGTALVFVACGAYSLKLKVGDANPGSPILWPQSQYNVDSTAINNHFSGSDRMFVVVGGGKPNDIKKTAPLATMQKFQRYMESQPEIGGTLSIADVLPAINRILREDNVRYQELGADELANGELMFMFEQTAEPGDLARFVDEDRANASVTLYFTDHQGTTIQTAIARINQFIAENPPMEGARIYLAGGLVGVIAAVNEVILSGQIESIALALLVLMVMCIAVYRSSAAGMFFMVPVVVSNVVTFAFMAWQNIGMNINTVPVAALGIGLGVDYALYICDRIKSEYEQGKTEQQAIWIAIHCAGRGVLVTALVLVSSVLLWRLSSLRFQAEMGTLIALWLGVSAFCALFVMPAMATIFRPSFIFEPGEHTVRKSQHVEHGGEPPLVEPEAVA
jgi:predicted RND superfamily exporter protein